MSNKLSDWLPLLEHPEVGERICEAAGCRVSSGVDLDGAPAVWLWWDYEQDSGLDELTVAESAALAFGTLAVLADTNNKSSLRNHAITLGMQEGWAEPDYPAAVLAAARKVWLEGDNDE